MSIVLKPTLSAIWSTDAHGICVASQENPKGLLPALKGVTLSAWLEFAQADDDAMIAQQLTAALEMLTPFHIEVPINGTVANS